MIVWRRGSHSGGGHDDACVEVADLGRLVGVRDSKDPDGPRLDVGPREFGRFVARVRAGEFDRRT
ncbi:DUF397 domain-containing protein [Actinomadura sp. WMMB 499]|uniref:DUF397 domain-containing protein n=1 Tax=Actinomadura sp. WMMB 499 TaxID=1219491 RepID=UPI0012493D71|nr:DUF397 domain-containing protein [Actinomadura sp. WMMB 499]